MRANDFPPWGTVHYYYWRFRREGIWQQINDVLGEKVRLQEKRNDDVTGFSVLPKCWIVERTFAWLGRYRRLSKDYEALPGSSESMILIAMINLTRRSRNQTGGVKG